MIRCLIAGLAVAGLAAANPIVETILSEVSIPAGGNPWFELHQGPPQRRLDLTGWLVVTSSTVCTLDCSIGEYEYLVIDSAAIASGMYGHGTFRLNPGADSIRVIPESVRVWPPDAVRYPALPTGWTCAPAPPVGASIASCNFPEAYNQVLNWYVDSTPTPGGENDDWSEVRVLVTWDSGLAVSEGQVYISGDYGSSSPLFMAQGEVALEGLGAGTYRLGASARVQGHGILRVEYPESIEVGYSQLVTGINLHFSLQGVAENEGPPDVSARAATITRGVLFLGAGTALQSGASDALGLSRAVLLDIYGRKVAALHPGPNDVRNLAPGVYFVRPSSGVVRSASRIERASKVIVTR